MGTFVSYMIPVTVMMTLLYLAYRWLMASTTFFRFNRVALLVIYLLSWILPALLSFVSSTGEAEGGITVGMPVVSMTAGAGNGMTSGSGIDWCGIVIPVYFSGVILITLYTVYGVWRTIRIIRSGSRRETDGAILVITDRAPGPFSWGRYIVLRPSDCDQSMDMVMAHEKCHLSLRHWMDLVPAQITAILQWYSPAAWLMIHEIKDCHEYEVDSIVAGDNPAAYQMMLIRKAVGSSFPTFADSLNHSQIKKRITMMMTKKTSPSRRAAALALPAAAVLAMFTISRPAVADVMERLSLSTLSDESVGKDSESSRTMQMPLVRPADSLDEAAIADSPAADVPVPDHTPVLAGDSESVPARQDDAEKNTSETATGNGASVNETSDKVYATVEKIPEFKGGMKALLDFLKETIQYPEGVEASEERHMVVVRFTVGKDGSVKDPAVVRSGGEAFDREAIRAVSLTSGQWEPGYNGSEAVSSSFTLPVVFKK